MRLPEDGSKCEPKLQLSIETSVSSSIGLFLLLCWWPNTMNRDTQQDANSEGHENDCSLVFQVSFLLEGIELLGQ
jgi:hypothetical protein